MTLRVNVTAADIRRGRPQSATTCPVARAIRRHKGFEKALVDSLSWSITSPYDSEGLLPLKVERFIRRFDDGKPVDPFTFDLTVTA